MRYCIRDHTIDITCSTGELYTMHERGMAFYGMLPPPAPTRVSCGPSCANEAMEPL